MYKDDRYVLYSLYTSLCGHLTCCCGDGGDSADGSGGDDSPQRSGGRWGRWTVGPGCATAGAALKGQHHEILGFPACNFLNLKIPNSERLRFRSQGQVIVVSVYNIKNNTVSLNIKEANLQNSLLRTICTSMCQYSLIFVYLLKNLSWIYSYSFVKSFYKVKPNLITSSGMCIVYPTHEFSIFSWGTPTELG